MEPGSLLVYRPVWFLVLLALVLLVLPISVIPFWQGIVSRIENQVQSNSASFTSVLMSEVEDTAKLFLPMNSTAMIMARILKFSLTTGTMLSFSDIKIKVVPLMFHTISVVPMMSEISYIGSDGLIFSYYFDGNKLVSLYANTSNPSAPSSSHNWYRQLVNPDTGSLYGSAVLSQPLLHTHNSTWYQEAFNSPSGYHASFKAGWNGGSNLVLVNTARVADIGLISIGFSVKSLSKVFSSIDLNGGSLYLIAAGDGRVLLQGLPNTRLSLNSNRSISFRVLSMQGEAEQIMNFSCNSCAGDGESTAPSITYDGLKYVLYCSPLEILGTESVYVLAVRENFLKSFIHRGGELVLILLVALTVLLLMVIFGFVCIVVRAARREMLLLALLVEQTKAAEQAESKRKNKSIAFANASHDIRASLACITALIEMCYFEGALSPELKKNLQQMDSCAKDLLGLLNSILDTSKIEAGKMLIEEEEFDVMQLLEDVVDMFHPVAMKKGVDVVLDLFEGSILKNSIVKGDRGKLKQILSNLLSNAVKFTPEGHITVRGWAQEPTLEDTTQTDDQIQKAQRKRLSWLFFWERDENKDLEAKSTFKRKPNSMEFVFEVDDTGKGIPKEKRKSVFESYVQVKETAQGQGGTGLGLGIVQSLVRLMGGDIKIKDKETGERGTCFCFKILLSVSGATNVFPETLMREDDTDVLSESLVSPGQGTMICTTRPSPRFEGSSLAILLIGDEERRRVSTIFMERLGIKVWVGKEWAELPSILREVQRKLGLSCLSSPREPDDVSQNTESPASRFLLLVIDTSFGPIMELIRLVSEFRGGLQSSNTADCKVVWLDKPSVHHRRVLEEEGKVNTSVDVIFSRPFHGTHLIKAVKLFPEFGGPTSAAVRNERGKMKETVAGPDETLVGEKREEGQDEPRLLSGKRVLLVEDSMVLCRFAKSVLLGLGATVDVCENGEEAVMVVSSKLIEQKKTLAGGTSSSSGLPYSFILMDCEMPIMDGYEATRRIREEEEKYDIRIPIIAVTAHSQGAELKMTFEAGMDSYIDKPLKKERLVELLGQMNIIT